ncbi:MAG: glycosyltransferase family 2 protein [Candidatus Hadarchaeales archaeon]
MITAVVVGKNEPNLERCLRSLRDQETKINEIIYCDGGSTDDSVEVARSLADRVLILGRGIGLDRVEGIRRATNNLILSTDADAIYPPNYASVAKEILQANSAGFGPVYPIEDNFWGRLESWTIKLSKSAGAVYEHNTCFRKDLFFKLMLDRSPWLWLHPRNDIGPILKLLLPKWDERYYCFSRLPTKLFIYATWPVEFARNLGLGALATARNLLQQWRKNLP